LDPRETKGIKEFKVSRATKDYRVSRGTKGILAVKDSKAFRVRWDYRVLLEQRVHKAYKD
jgi:hypothetical protein